MQACFQPDQSAIEWAEALLRRIARPRLSGTRESEDAQSAISDHLAKLGYDVEVERFDTSPIRLVIASLAGLGCAILIASTGSIYLLVTRGLDRPTAIVLTTCAVLGLVSVVLSYFRGTKHVSAGNIVAVRGQPRLWFVAHSDSKGQVPSLAGRVVALAIVVSGAVLLTVLVVLELAVDLPPLLILLPGIVSLAGGIALNLDPVRNDSPGAVDNASGVIAALAAASATREREDVGILITDAEEFGMQGARNWAARNTPEGVFVNFDGIDSVGPCRVMVHATPKGKTTNPASMASSIESALKSLGNDARTRRLPFGVFVDGAVLASAGMPGVTVSRGNLATLKIIHTRYDKPERLDVGDCVAVGESAAGATVSLLG